MNLLQNFKLHYLPIITCVWFIFGFAITYMISVLNGHVYAIFPYISDTGTKPPESCVFAQMLNIGAVLMGVNNYIRYRQIDFAIASNNIKLSKYWNKVALWLGTLMAIGISIVGNFQQTPLFAIHIIGALMSFGLSAIYFSIQTRITFAFRTVYEKYPKYDIGRSVIYLRLFLSITYVVLFFVVFSFSPLAFQQFTGDRLLWWTPEHGGYGYHVTATVSEWLLFGVILLYVLTGTVEFKSLEFKEICFTSKLFDVNSNA